MCLWPPALAWLLCGDIRPQKQVGGSTKVNLLNSLHNSEGSLINTIQWVRFPRNGFCPHVYIRRQNPIISKPPPYGSVDLKANVPSIILDVAPGHFHKSRTASTAARTTLLHTNLDTQKPVGTTGIRVSGHRSFLGSCAEVRQPRWQVWAHLNEMEPCIRPGGKRSCSSRTADLPRLE